MTSSQLPQVRGWELSSHFYSDDDDDGLIAEAFDYIFYLYNINNIIIFRLKE